MLASTTCIPLKRRFSQQSDASGGVRSVYCYIETSLPAAQTARVVSVIQTNGFNNSNNEFNG